jgi:hypothetical protein
MSKLALIAARGTWERPTGVAVRAATDAVGIAVLSVPMDLPGSATTYRNAIAEASRPRSGLERSDFVRWH